MSSNGPATTQDTEHCAICGGPLGFVPRLGDWIMHERCCEAVMARVEEAEQRAARNERRRVLDIAEVVEREHGPLTARRLHVLANGTPEVGPLQVVTKVGPDSTTVNIEQPILWRPSDVE